MKKLTKACTYCHSKKIKCIRNTEDDECSKCLELKQDCINRAKRKTTVVFIDEMESQQEEIKRLKAKIKRLEVHQAEFKDSGSGIAYSSPVLDTEYGRRHSQVEKRESESFTTFACIKCSTSSIKFCNHLNDCLDGYVHKSWQTNSHNYDFTKPSQDCEFVLPSKHEGMELLQTTYHTIGNDYYLLVLSDTLAFVEKVYNSIDMNEFPKVELARLFFLFALGEFYSYRRKERQGNFPGIKYFKLGLSLLQNDFERPTLAQIEVLLLATIFFNSMAFLKHAYSYIGICIRLATILGLDNSSCQSQSQSDERGNRIMATIYTLEVSLCSSLGFRVMLPALPVEKFALNDSTFDHDLGERYIIKKRVTLANINRQIIERVYLGNENDEQLFTSINQIIKDLNDFYEELMLEWKNMDSDVRSMWKYSSVSLKLRFNECIILAIRPILYSVFISKTVDDIAHKEFNWESLPHAIRLSEVSINAAMTNINIINDLFSKEDVAYWGYYDVNFLFSAGIVIELANSLDCFSQIVFQNSVIGLPTFSDMTESLLSSIADTGYPLAKSLKHSIRQLKHKLKQKGPHQVSNNTQFDLSSSVDLINFEKLLEDIIPHDFEFGFENNLY